MSSVRWNTLLASVLLAGSLAPSPARADWPQFGTALSTAEGNQVGPTIAPDGAGGAIVGWNDRRNPAHFNLDVRHLLASGAADPAWPTDGRALLTDSLADVIIPDGQELPIVISDGAGGVIVAWSDGRSSVTGFDVYADHVLASGALDPAWPINGLVVSAAAGSQSDPVLVSDGAGGAIVAWIDGRAGGTVTALDVYAQHVLAAGHVDAGWPGDGTALCTAAGSQAGLALIGDGAGGALVTWSDGRTGNPGSDIYAQHVSGAGVVDPAWPVNGLGLCTAPGTQSTPDIIADEGTGGLVAWTDLRDGTNEIYALRVSFAGAFAAGWPANGRLVSIGGVDEVAPSLAPDGAGGAVVTWSGGNTGHHNIHAQHVPASGVLDPAWPVGGSVLSFAPSEETNQSSGPDGAGGAFVTWAVGQDIRAQHVLPTGALDPTFSVNGRPLCDLPSTQRNPVIASAGADGPIVAWNDQRNDVDFDVYALRVFAAGAVGTDTPPPAHAISFAPPSPSPAAGPVALRFALPRGATASLAIFDLGGRRVRDLAGGSLGSGEQSVAWDLRDDNGRRVPPGLYFARLGAGPDVLVRKLVLR